MPSALDKPVMLNLLAKDGTAYDQRGGFLGRLLHDFTKWAIRRAVRKIARRMRPVTEWKLKKGWVNPEIGLLYDDFNWLISLDEAPTEPGAFRGPDDKNRALFQDLRDIMCVMLDEDTHYGIRFWVLMHRIHEKRWEEAYSIAMNRSNAFFNYREIYAGLLERSKPLPRLEDERIKSIEVIQ